MEIVLWRNHSRWERGWAELKAGGKLVDLETENKVGLLELGDGNGDSLGQAE